MHTPRFLFSIQTGSCCSLRHIESEMLLPCLYILIMRSYFWGRKKKKKRQEQASLETDFPEWFMRWSELDFNLVGKQRIFSSRLCNVLMISSQIFDGVVSPLRELSMFMLAIFMSPITTSAMLTGKKSLYIPLSFVLFNFPT